MGTRSSVAQFLLLAFSGIPGKAEGFGAGGSNLTSLLLPTLVEGRMGPVLRPRAASGPSWAALSGSNALSMQAAPVLVAPVMTCSWPRRPLRVAGEHEEALPVDGRAGVAAWVIADTHVALVQLYCDVVIVPVVQQDAIVLCRGHLVGKGTFSPTPSHVAAAQAGRWSRWGTHNWKGDAACRTAPHGRPRCHVLQGGTDKG